MAGGFEYSTTAGGECDGGDKGKPVCSWKAVEPEKWPTADAACVAAALVAAARGAADAGETAGSAAMAALDAAFVDGSPCRI